MLRDGQFIKEDPPKIGAHYVPSPYKRKTAPEELLVQDILLSDRPAKRPPLLSKVLRAVLCI